MGVYYGRVGAHHGVVIGPIAARDLQQPLTGLHRVVLIGAARDIGIPTGVGCACPHHVNRHLLTRCPARAGGCSRMSDLICLQVGAGGCVEARASHRLTLGQDGRRRPARDRHRISRNRDQEWTRERGSPVVGNGIVVSDHSPCNTICSGSRSNCEPQHIDRRAADGGCDGVRADTADAGRGNIGDRTGSQICLGDGVAPGTGDAFPGIQVAIQVADRVDLGTGDGYLAVGHGERSGKRRIPVVGQYKVVVDNLSHAGKGGALRLDGQRQHARLGQDARVVVGRHVRLAAGENTGHNNEECYSHDGITKKTAHTLSLSMRRNVLGVETLDYTPSAGSCK